MAEKEIKLEVEEQEELLPPREVAKRLRVVPKTVSRWADQGKLTPVFLPSGHRRYRASEVRAILNPPIADKIPTEKVKGSEKA